MNKMTRMMAAIAIACACSMILSTAHANSLSNAFGSLGGSVKKEDAGYYKSQARNTYTGGSGRIRFPPEGGRPSLGISFSAPNVEVGCNGIDWHLGGMSWVDNVKIEQLLKGVARGALMYVIKIGINALCEDCATELQNVIDTIRQATESATNSCKLGEQLAQSGLEKAGVNTCQNLLSITGQNESFEDGRDDCEDGEESYFQLLDENYIADLGDTTPYESVCGDDNLADCIFGGGDPDDKTQEQRDAEKRSAKLGLGNRTWQYLTRSGYVLEAEDVKALKAGSMSEDEIKQVNYMGIAMGELLMSYLGADIRLGGQEKKFVPPTLAADATSGRSEILLGTMLCGANYFKGDSSTRDGGEYSDLTKTTIKNTCDKIFGNADGSSSGGGGSPGYGSIDQSSVKVLVCANPNNTTSGGSLVDPTNFSYASYRECFDGKESKNDPDLNYGVRKIDFSDWVKRPYVAAVMDYGTLGLTMNRLSSILEKLITARPGVDSEPLTKDEIGFIEAIPFPMYKILNQAAIFEVQRTTVMKTYGEIIGLLLAREFIYSYFQSIGQYSSSDAAEMGEESARIEERLNKTIATIGRSLLDAQDRISNTLELTQLISTRIANTEQRIRDSIFSRSMLGNEAFIMDVGKRFGQGSTAP